MVLCPRNTSFAHERRGEGLARRLLIEAFPYFQEFSLLETRDLTLKLVHLPHHENQPRGEDASSPFPEQSIDKRPRKYRVLQVAEAVLDFHRFTDKGVQRIAVSRAYKFRGVAQPLELDAKLVEI